MERTPDSLRTTQFDSENLIRYRQHNLAANDSLPTTQFGRKHPHAFQF
jgi:hypothetical protein